MSKKKLIRITTVPISLDKLLSGQLNYMTMFYEVIAVSSEKKYLEQVGENEKVSVFHLEMTRKITPLKDFFAILKLYFFLRKEQPQIIHSHTPKAGLVSMVAAKLARVPIRLHTVAGLPLMEAKGMKRKILVWVEKMIYFCATRVYPNSEGLHDFILNEGFCSKEKIKVIGKGSSNGINTRHFCLEKIDILHRQVLKDKLKIGSEDFVFIFVGRLVTDKGINELIQAFQKIHTFFQNAKLLLVGPYETELDPLKKETVLEIENNTAIIHVGYQPDVRPYFAISNVLVFPSYREGFPNVVMQAGAMELPCIVTDINGCNEIIMSDYNGLIIPVKNANAIFEGMKLFLEDTLYYQKLKLHARKKIVENYEQETVWKAVLDEYKKQENNV
ncbi:MAG: glycosyltransferase family 1 protein [Flavobacterium sp.]|uniref:glycosyltransferase family 4 protein n=1 Tax=Flavobacterium sp. TaxID=239 RepID=UPI000C6683BC|nr:glycosyltransferase family 4 protein [Flavobacterium sp.]MBF02159.1 glycosyltransferase family 1 protein [Flavobacterium sp.]|tara:strand:- start:4542 stop:5702 length:1161 start_codon:yes stop_codon:yes gene_type:complete